MSVHSDHDAVAAALRAVYRNSYLELGWVAEERPFGIYRRNANAATYPNVILGNVTPSDVPDLISDVRAYCDEATLPVRIMIEDRDQAATLGPALEAAGLILDEPTIFLAHVGDLPEERDAPGVRIETVGRGGLYEYEDTRRKAFADSEEPSPPEDLESRVQLRLAEMAGGACYWLARADGQPAACMSWYNGEDRFVFSLGTRVPYRSGGIARLLLTRLLHESRAAGTRAVIVNADEDGAPVRLYRRLGFTDELYWRVTYELPPA